MQHILAADIGGTHSRFGHFTLCEGALRVRNIVRCATAALHNTHDALRQAAATGLHPSKAHICVFAVAGPVWESDHAQPTNAPLLLDFRNQDLRALCINDFAAQAFATLTLPGIEALCICPGIAVAMGTRAVIGAGTGLGMASLVWHKGSAVALSSEGGHAAFAFEGKDELAFAAFLAQALDVPFVSAEHVLSGRGLMHLHRFLTGENILPAEIARDYLSNSSSALHETALWFARLYGRTCQHVALHTLCRGGLYITGGIAAKNPLLVQCAAFAEAFLRAPAHAVPLLQAVPLWLMQHEYAGLWGAARAAQEYIHAHYGACHESIRHVVRAAQFGRCAFSCF